MIGKSLVPTRGLVSMMRSAPAERDSFPLSFDQYLELFQYQGQTFPFMGGGSLAQPTQEAPRAFQGMVEQAYRSNGVVFAVMLVRMMLFSEARFQFRRMVNGRPGDLFGTPALNLLEKPWPNGTTGDLLARMIRDADLEGNFFCARALGPDGQPQLQHLRPDWVTIVMGSRIKSDHPNWERDAKAIGYIYQPGGNGSGADPEVLLTEQVAHFAPIPDPLARYRGMSWLTPVVREIMGDASAMTHKQKYFELGATPNTVVSLDSSISPENFQKFVDVFEDQHVGLLNAYKTIYLGGGADVKVVGSNLQQLDFKTIQGHGETRIAAAGGTPPVIVGLSEGLESATYSNYAQARRRFADGTMRPLWRNAAATLERILTATPDGATLWYDDRDIPFLQEDVLDNATIMEIQARTIKELVISGFDPDSVISAVTSGDMARLQHTGLYSVQLQPADNAKAGVVKGVPQLVDQPVTKPEAPVKPVGTGKGKSTNGAPPKPSPKP